MKMKFKLILTFMTVLFFISNIMFAQDSTKSKDEANTNAKKHNQKFVDKDGDGYNDNAPDHDGDGIPNGLDPDWDKNKNQEGKRHRWRYVDLDGDGINDFIQENPEMRQEQMDPLMQQKREGAPLDEQRKMQGEEKKRKMGNKN